MTNETINAPVWRKGTFCIDEQIVPYPTGYTQGVHWNGWAMPVFTLEQAEHIMAYVNRDNAGFAASQLYLTFTPDDDAFTIYDPDDEEMPRQVKGVDILCDGQAVHVYPLGTGEWTWDEIEPSPAREESPAPTPPIHTLIVLRLNGRTISAAHLPPGLSVELRDYDVPDDWEAETDEEGQRYQSIILGSPVAPSVPEPTRSAPPVTDTPTQLALQAARDTLSRAVIRTPRSSVAAAERTVGRLLGFDQALALLRWQVDDAGLVSPVPPPPPPERSATMAQMADLIYGLARTDSTPAHEHALGIAIAAHLQAQGINASEFYAYMGTKRAAWRAAVRA